jgi:NagD protein
MGELPFVAEMARAGFRLTENPDEIEYVVAAFDRTFDYRKYNIAFQAIKKGARYPLPRPDLPRGRGLPTAPDHRRPGGDDSEWR